MANVILVEDDAVVRDVVEYALRREGIEVKAVQDAETALTIFDGSGHCDLLLLDVMLPGMDGVTLCREIRARSTVPIVMLTARSDETSVVVGLEVGADDYIVKPFNTRELVSRVRAHLRRRQLDAQGQERRMEFQGLSVDLLRREVVANGSTVELTAKEFEILSLLVSHPGRVFGREEIMRHLWNGDFYGEARAADVHVQHIRGKIEPDPKHPSYIETVRGAGYRFAGD